MTTTPKPGDAADPAITPRSMVQKVIDLTISACDAYDRDDLRARLESSTRSVAERDAQVIVAGEFKQGKSSLINALLGAEICPVDDDIATAACTFLRHAPALRAEVIHTDTLHSDGSPAALTGEPIDLTDLRRFVTEHHDTHDAPRPVKAVNDSVHLHVFGSDLDPVNAVRTARRRGPGR